MPLNVSYWNGLDLVFKAAQTKLYKFLIVEINSLKLSFGANCTLVPRVYGALSLLSKSKQFTDECKSNWKLECNFR